VEECLSSGPHDWAPREKWEKITKAILCLTVWAVGPRPPSGHAFLGRVNSGAAAALPHSAAAPTPRAPVWHERDGTLSGPKLLCKLNLKAKLESSLSNVN